MHFARTLFAFAAIVLLGAPLGAGGYESVVMVPNYQNDIPNSLEHFRSFMRVANPGNFFRVVAPSTQIALLLCVITFWRIRAARWWYVLGLVAIVSADVVTFTFHYPRNHLLFHSPMTTPVAQLTAAAREWAAGNYLRIALILVSIFAASVGLKKGLLQRPEGSAA